MANGQHWFKTYQSDFLTGTAGMPPEQFAVYVRVIWMMYEADGPVVRNDKYMAGLCGLGIRAFREALQKLLQMQKLCYSEETLQLSNFRAENEIVKRRKIHDVRVIAQAASVASKKLKANKNNANGLGNGAHNVAQTPAQKPRKNLAILEAREEEGKEVHTDLPSSSEKAASLASRKSLASPLSRPTLEKFIATYPANNGINYDSENDRLVLEHWWAGLDAEEKSFAIEEIPNLLAWYNEAPTDPERIIWPANDWLQGRKWRDVWVRCPHMAPDARIQPEEAVA